MITQAILTSTGGGFEVAGKAETQWLDKILDEKEKIFWNEQNWNEIQESEQSFEKQLLTSNSYHQGACEDTG